MPPFATPDIAQHSSGLPHRVPLCQWVEREGTARLLTTCCHWTHLRRPQNYCVAFSPTLLLFPSPSPPSFHRPPSSRIPPFLPMPSASEYLEFSHHQQASPSSFKKKTFIIKLSCSKRPLMSDRGFKAGEHSHQEGRRKRMNVVVHFAATRLYKIPEAQSERIHQLFLQKKNMVKSASFFF